ncbi:hypothetical protein AAF712_013207 [Marasmius tenuissimus]|uniref:Transmembrane protein n=1 Tax=Marasmius tenuissimus TaxID=585030 RepID=A0ABR2ZFE3_9AGAR
MPSFRTLVVLFLAGISFASAGTTPEVQKPSPTDPHPKRAATHPPRPRDIGSKLLVPILEKVQHPTSKRCDAACAAKSSPVSVIVEDVQKKISPMLEKIYALKECKADEINPIVTDITSIIDGATAQVKTYVDAKVDLNIALAATADVDAKAGVAVSLDVLVRLFISLVTSIVICVKAALDVTVKAELDACIKIFATLGVSLGAFLQVCCQLVAGLAVSLAVQLTTFVALCVQLGVDVSVTAFLNIQL